MIGNKFKGLGRGLSALMGDIPQDNVQTKSSSEKIPIHFVYANPSQPRKNFNQELLNVSDKIKSKVLEKIKELTGNKESASKAENYVDEFLSRENLEEKKVA